MGWFDNISSDDGGNSFSFLPSLIGSIASAYTGYKSYESQRDASELQYEAAQQQVVAAGFQAEAAAKQEMAALESQRLSELNAIDSEMQSAREIENTRMAQEQAQGEARARAAASGVTLTGSTGSVLTEQERVHGEELGWMAKAGGQKADIIRKQGETAMLTGQAQADQTRAASSGTLAGASATEAQAKGTMAGAYGSAGSTFNKEHRQAE